MIEKYRFCKLIREFEALGERSSNFKKRVRFDNFCQSCY